MATHQGELPYERFGAIGSVSATSLAWLSYCHAECGAFTEGLAMAEEGLRLYAKTGQCEQAWAELSTAIALYRAMEMTFWLPQAEATMASLSSGTG